MKPVGAGWRNIPFVKLLSALITGILVEYYVHPYPFIWQIILVFSLALLISVFFLPYFRRFKLSSLAGCSAFILFICLGGLLTLERDIRNDRNWVGHFKTGNGMVSAVMDEPPVEKPNSYKFIASLQSIHADGKTIPVRGKILVYLRKSKTDSTRPLIPVYGNKVIFRNQLNTISGFGNPGGFDYGRYCLLKGITHQVFLNPGDFTVLDEKKINPFRSFIFKLREKIVGAIRLYIKGEKESGLAEALLIGYKNDLDRSLVKDYADTGVVHIIAISGLHVGLIYFLLLQVFRSIRKTRLSWLAAILMIAGLWFFSFLAGAQPSILRAALMFSCIIIEKEVSGKNSTYNTIAFSAFILLCIDPFWLWDAGFQLSYAAVISIIAFMRPVYGFIYIKNKWLDQAWKMNAVTIAAQVFTLPLCLYYFQQFPNYFLLTNFLAVPLSSIILIGEIILLLLTTLPVLAVTAGAFLNWLIHLMNECITFVARFPYATWESLHISVAQTFLLIVFAAGICFGLLEKQKRPLHLGFFSLAVFFTLRAFSFYDAYQQERIIVYNVPGLTAIDLIKGRHYDFLGDSILAKPGPERELYLDPSRTFFRTSRNFSRDPISENELFEFSGKKIWMLKRELNSSNASARTEIDLLLLSGNPRLYLSRLASVTRIRQVVIDASVPAWKSNYWKKDCDSLGIPWHDVRTQGAFEMKTR